MSDGRITCRLCLAIIAKNLDYNATAICEDCQDAKDGIDRRGRKVEELYYVGYREVFEKPERNGYTTHIKEAGKFTFDDVLHMVTFNEVDGCNRWFIACSALDSFKDGEFHPEAVY